MGSAVADAGTVASPSANDTALSNDAVLTPRLVLPVPVDLANDVAGVCNRGLPPGRDPFWNPRSERLACSVQGRASNNVVARLLRHLGLEGTQPGLLRRLPAPCAVARREPATAVRLREVDEARPQELQEANLLLRLGPPPRGGRAPETEGGRPRRRASARPRVGAARRGP